MVTYQCAYCGQPYQRQKGNPSGRFCGQRCATFMNRPSAALLIPDGEPMSKRTRFRRRRAAGLTRPDGFYAFNEEFFFRWSDELAWVLGLIWSDGCLFGNTVEICSKDSQIVELVAALIDQPNGIRLKNGGGALRVVFTSCAVAAFLRSLGLTEAKSFTAPWPELPPRLEGHFLRGLLDGDGSVLLNQRRPGQQVPDLSVQWCGAAPLLLAGITSYLSANQIRFSAGWQERNGRALGLWKITVQQQDSLRRLYGLMYPHQDVPTLSRKAAGYLVWMETPRVRPGRPNRTPSAPPPLAVPVVSGPA